MSSPFKFVVLDGEIVRQCADKESFRASLGADLEKICEYINNIDEELWSLRRVYTKDVGDLREKIEKIQDILLANPTPQSDKE